MNIFLLFPVYTRAGFSFRGCQCLRTLQPWWGNIIVFPPFCWAAITGLSIFLPRLPASHFKHGEQIFGLRPQVSRCDATERLSMKQLSASRWSFAASNGLVNTDNIIGQQEIQGRPPLYHSNLSQSLMWHQCRFLMSSHSLCMPIKLLSRGKH